MVTGEAHFNRRPWAACNPENSGPSGSQLTIVARYFHNPYSDHFASGISGPIL